jgi:ElaA protein
MEMDGRDDECVHLLARDGEGAVGTARLRAVDGAAKAERVAVLDSHRGRGVGRLLMGVLENEARERGLAPVVLNAQLDVVRFYEKLGYGVRGEVFEEAGIPHRPMQKPSP